MHGHVPKSGEFAPWDLGLGSPYLAGQVLARFGDDIHTAAQKFQRIQQQPTQGEGAGPWSRCHQQKWWCWPNSSTVGSMARSSGANRVLLPDTAQSAEATNTVT